VKAIIAGAGIGGLTAARALAQAGIDVAVFERADSLSALGLGSGLSLQMNAMWALQHVGLAEAVEAAGVVGQVSEFRRWNGTLLAQWPEAEIGQRLGAPTVHINRAALHPVLAQGLPTDCVRTGTVVTSFVDDGAGVTVTLDDGTEERGDVLVGADGLYSTVRAQLHGAPPPRYAGYSVWRGVASFSSPLLTPGLFRMCWGQGRRFCVYPVGDDLWYWFGVEDSAADRTVARGARRGAVLEAFGTCMAPSRDLMEATEDDAIHLTPIYDRPPIGEWGRGRVTLLGDAAHPMTFNLGQGACQAIEDGVVLGNALATASGSGDMAGALRRYESRRMKRTASMTNGSWRIGQMGRLRHPAAVAARDAMLRAAFGFVVRRQAKSMIVDLSFS
jgi:2-polyprenyl-6-methoxyphenol hydroxylase-like FAD-dependent oxidoreductase